MSSNFVKVHKKRENFTIIENEFLNSYGFLNAKEKFFLIYLYSKPENWKFRVKDFMNKVRDKQDSIYSGIKKLAETGFISRVRNDDLSVTYHIFLDPRENPILDHWCADIQNKFLKENFGIERQTETETETPCRENPDKSESQLNSAFSSCRENPYKGKPYKENPDTYKEKNNSKTYSLYSDFPNFMKFIENYPKEKRYIQRESCLNLWIESGLENDPLIEHYIEQTKAYEKIQRIKKTEFRYIKNPYNFLNEKRYKDDYLKMLDYMREAKQTKGASNESTKTGYIYESSAISEEERQLALLLGKNA